MDFRKHVDESSTVKFNMFNLDAPRKERFDKALDLRFQTQIEHLCLLGPRSLMTFDLDFPTFHMLLHIVERLLVGHRPCRKLT